MMKLDKLIEEVKPAVGTVPRQTKVDVAGGSVELVYYPPPAGAADMPLFDFLNLHMVGWDVTDNEGLPAPLNADRIVSLSPEAKDAFRDAILARPRARPKPVVPETANEPVAHGSFEPVAVKPAAKPEGRKHD